MPFQAAVDAGVDLVMMSSAVYPDYAGATPGTGRVKPAVFAEPIVAGTAPRRARLRRAW